MHLFICTKLHILCCNWYFWVYFFLHEGNTWYTWYTYWDSVIKYLYILSIIYSLPWPHTSAILLSWIDRKSPRIDIQTFTLSCCLLSVCQACLTQLDEEFVYNPLSLSSNLYQHLRSRGLLSQQQYPYRSQSTHWWRAFLVETELDDDVKNVLNRSAYFRGKHKCTECLNKMMLSSYRMTLIIMIV